MKKTNWDGYQLNLMHPRKLRNVHRTTTCSVRKYGILLGSYPTTQHQQTFGVEKKKITYTNRNPWITRE